MKKCLSVLVVIVLVCIGLTACGENYNGTNSTQNNIVSENVVSQREIVALNTSNIDNYLIFSVYTSDIEKESIKYQGMDKAEGKATLKIGPKQAGTFENVSLGITLKTNKEYGWADKDVEIQIPFDGKAEYTYDIGSYIADYVSSSPSYEVVVTSVSGNFSK